MAHKTPDRKKSCTDCNSKKEYLVKAFVYNSFAEAITATVEAIKAGKKPARLVDADTLIEVTEAPDCLGHIFELDCIENEPDHVGK